MSGGRKEWSASDMQHGMLIVACTDPKVTAIEHSSALSPMRFETSAFPVLKLTADQPPVDCFA